MKNLGPDPRVMLVVAFVFAVGAVATPGLGAKIAYALGALAVWVILSLGVRKFFLILLPLTLFLIMTFVLRAVIQADQYADATTVAAIPFSISGMLVGVMLSLQVFTVVLGLGSAVLSNPPLALSEAAELLLKPLSRLKVPVHEGALMFSIALRFLPILADEFRRLTTAQATRGAALTNRSVFSRVRAIGPLVIPLFVVTLIRARELSEAIESRGYIGSEGRTLTRVYRLTARDYVLLALTALTVAISLVLALS
ncbi:MAG: energy-coupling factor transporter transmembrane component T family protein [Leucobacter sp.]